ncbi:pentatricopeptide repeat-containing protein At3g48250, chloroplastic isoform X2 [Andrographis paniculata]|nr:pentatricopeptide repeat-containing protein At3g48250, chloroplastic isoform X2 [Andrographis paniculata]XP_051136475.1 pentatricopeptide repeat-containing protein At3g48250, chloroplastic isoform X2 [Andrographis paniculata]
MNGAKRILSRCRFANPLRSPQISKYRSTPKQVTHCYHFYTFSPSRIPTLIDSNAALPGRRNHFFSSSPESLVDIFSSDDWSSKLDEHLESSKLGLNHETVIYVLKKLSNDPRKASEFFGWAVDKNGFEPSSSIYSLMLRIYARKDFMKEFWVTIKEMKEKGFYIDEETFKSIFAIFRGLKMEADATALKHFFQRLIAENAMEDCVKQVVETIRFSEWGVDVENKLEAMHFVVSDNFVLRVLKELRSKGCSSKAYSFFKWIENRLGYKHDSVTYNGVLRVLCWEDSIDRFWVVLDEMTNAGFEIDFDTYVKVSRQLQKNKMLHESVRLYEHMMNGSYKPSLKECNVLLRTLATHSNPDLDLVYRVVNKFEESGNSLSKHIYDGIHRSLTSLGKFAEAEIIVATMRNAGFEPDNITYSQSVFGLCKAKRFADARKIVDSMTGCDPDIKTWTILIKGHCDGGEIDGAVLCFGRMIEAGCDPDADVLDVLVNGFLSRGRTSGARELIVELAGGLRVAPWQSTFKKVIGKLLAERKLEEATEVLRVMKKQKYPAYTEPFVEYVCKYGTVAEAREVLAAMGGGSKFPAVAAYRNVLGGLVKEGRLSEANDLLFKCPHHIRKHPSVIEIFGSAAKLNRT